MPISKKPRSKAALKTSTKASAPQRCRISAMAARAKGVRLERAAVEGEEVRFAHDSPLEGSGFELSVPVRQAKLTRSCR